MTTLDGRSAHERLMTRFGFGRSLSDRVLTYSETLRQLIPEDVILSDSPKLGNDEPPVNSNNAKVKKAAELALTQQNDVLTVWWLGRMVSSRQSFVEKLTWFWHGHFATGAPSVRSAHVIFAQNETLRRLGGGRFDDLIAAMTVDPAMLIWLNGSGNRVGAPNENFARELMELFMLGVGNYVEADVREAARALTGWTVDKRSVSAKFDPRRHDS